MMKDSGASAIQRILIVKPSSPGDIIHALPVARALRAALPDAHISWLVATNFANLLQCETSINEIIKFDRKRYGRFGRSLSASGAFLGFLNELRWRRFDTVLDLQGLFRSGLFTFATGAKRRVGFRNARELAGMFYNARVDVPDDEIHAVERNLLFLKALGIETNRVESEASKQLAAEAGDSKSLVGGDELREEDASTPRNHRLQTGATAPVGPDLRIRFDDDDQAAVTSILQSSGIDTAARYVVLVPATRWETKQWDAARFGALAARIFERFGLKSVLVGGAGDIARGDEAEQSSGGHSINLCGKTTLRQLAAMIDSAALVVTADSTPMHMAAAHDVPLVALFGPTSPVRTGPFGHLDDVLRLDLECAPCYLRKLKQCPHQHRCMVDLTVERVFDEVVARLQ